MKLLRYLVIIFLATSLQLQAQLKPKHEQSEVNHHQSGEIINFELFDNNSSIKEEGVNYRDYSEVKFDVVKSNGFRVDKRAESGEVQWLFGNIQLDKSLNIEKRAEIWLEKAQASLGTHKILNEFIAIRQTSDHLGQ